MNILQSIPTTSVNTLNVASDGGKQVLLVGLKPAYAGKAQYQRNMRRQFERMKDIDHPAILRFLDMKEVADIGECVILEWQQGRSLSEWMAEGHSDDDKRRVLRQAAEALLFLNQKGIVLGDLNPDKVIITEKGEQVRLLAFSLAYADYLKEPAADRNCRAPEVKDETVVIDQRADVYSVGMMLRQSGLGGLQAVIEKATAFGRSDRYDDLSQLIDAIDHKPRSHGYASPSLNAGGGSANGVGRQKAAAFAAAFVVVAAIVAIVMWQNHGGGDTATAEQDTVAITATDQPADTVPVTGPEPAEQAASPETAAATPQDTLIMQMKGDLDKIYAKAATPQAARRKTVSYYRGLRRMLLKRQYTQEQLAQVDQAFAAYVNELSNASTASR